MSARDWRGLRRVLRLPLGKRAVRGDVDAELRFHVQGRVDELVAAGMSRPAAEAEVARAFGDYARIEAEVERIDMAMHRRRSLLERAATLRGDVRHACRTLLRQPTFSLVVVLTLAVGIGATAAIFHVVDRMVLRPLPYPHADRIVYLGWSWAGKGDYTGSLSPQKFEFFHAESHVFDALTAEHGISAILGGAGAGGGGEAGDAAGAVVQGLRVTCEFFRVVGASPAMGRQFASNECASGAPDVAVISHALWVSRFGSDPRIVGTVVTLDGRPYAVIGVMPASFEIAEESERAQLIVPLQFAPEELDDKGNNYLVIGRLRRGVTNAQATQDMALAYNRYQHAYPESMEKTDRGPRLFTYRELYVGGVESTLWLLFAATAFVLLLACANVANLCLARALSRQREFAVRTALGAGRGRIIRQLITESLLLGFVAAVSATVVGMGGVRGLMALGREATLRESQLAVDPRVVLFTTLVAVVASVTIGIAAALPATRMDLARALAEGGRSGPVGHRQRMWRNFLIGAESAIAMVLLVGAGLLIASFARIQAVDPGYARAGIVTARLSHAPAGYDSAATVAEFTRRVIAGLRATPGVSAAGAASSLPLERGYNLPMTVDGRQDATQSIEWRAATPGYFQTIGMRLLRGRNVSEADDRRAPGVVIINQSFADKFWPGDSPIGRRVWLGRHNGKAVGPKFDEPAREIVGVVADSKDVSLAQARARPTAWVPLPQVPRGLVRLPAFAARGPDAAVVVAAVRRATAAADPRMPAPDVTAMSDIVSASLSSRRFSMVLMTLFAAVALGLTSVGIYGVVAYSVARRVHEIGVRLALGARPVNVLALVMRQGMTPVVAGLAAGLAASLALTRSLASMLYGVGPRDPRAIASVAALLAAVAAMACLIPARRAASGDPLRALREE
jgi:putative ABC transport system permease protein